MEKLFSYLEGLKSAMLGEFAKLSTAQTELTDAKAELAKANTALSEALAKNSDLSGKLATAEASVSDFSAKLKTSEETVAAHVKEITELKGKVTEADARAEKASKEANEAIANAGLPAGNLPAASAPASKSHFEIYSQLISEGKQNEANAYFAKHSEKIISRK